MKEKAESAASDLQISSSSIVSSIISSLLGAEIVSDAPFRMNIFGIAGAWLDLLTETPYMDVHGSDIAGIHGLVAPHVRKQLFPAVDLVRITGQKLQQIELLGC